MKRILFATLAAALFGAPAASAAPVFFGGHSYEEFTVAGAINWSAAQAAAVAAGGNLVIIESAAEDAFLKAAFDVFNPANPANITILTPIIVFGPWIGLRHIPALGPNSSVANYRWVDGTSVADHGYNGFFTGEPSGDGFGVHYLFNDFDFSPARQGWNDQGENTNLVRSYIVERVPEPATLGLLGLGLAGLGFARARRREEAKSGR